jgi:threonine dehydrogenase-like Zn-dependent dehydrogenase
MGWAINALAKAGTLSIIGVYPPNAQSVREGDEQEPHPQHGQLPSPEIYIPLLIEPVRTGAVDPTEILTQAEPLSGAIDAYGAFDRRDPGWIKVELVPAKAAE